MFHRSPFCSLSFHWGSLSACRATMERPRVPSTMSLTSEKSGHAWSTRAPSERKTRQAPAATRATSASTGMRPFRSGVHAMRSPFTEGDRSACVKTRVSTA